MREPPDVPGDDDTSAGAQRRRRWRRLVLVLVAAVIVEFLVLPQLAGARKALQLVGRVEPGWLAAGVLFEVAAIVCYAELTRTLLPVGTRPPLRTVLRVTLSTLSISHVVPGGAAVGSSLGYRLLTGVGVRGSDAAFALAAQSVGSAVVLNVLLWVGLVASIPARGFHPLSASAAIVGALLLAAVGAALILLTKGEHRLAAVVCRMADRIPFVDGGAVVDVLRRVAGRLRELAADPRLVLRGTLWATLNWVLDAAALWVLLAAFGHRAGLDALIISYGLAHVLAAIPITPGGLGVVEAVLTATLVGFGTSRGIAVLGVVSYRLVNFWLPIPLGGMAYLSLRVGAEEELGARSARLRRVAEEVDEVAPRPAQWAREHGVRLPHPRRGRHRGDAAQ